MYLARRPKTVTGSTVPVRSGPEMCPGLGIRLPLFRRSQAQTRRQEALRLPDGGLGILRDCQSFAAPATPRAAADLRSATARPGEPLPLRGRTAARLMCRLISTNCAADTRPAGRYWPIALTYVSRETSLARSRMMGSVPAVSPGITKWRTSTPRFASPCSSHFRTPVWRCISRTLRRATAG